MAELNLEQLKSEGWRFHIKKVKNKEYIIGQRKLPGQKKRESRSLGPYNEELWKKLEALGMAPTNKGSYLPIKTENGLEEIQEQIKKLSQRQLRFSEALVKRKKYPKTKMDALEREIREVKKEVSKLGKVRADDVVWTWKNLQGQPTTSTTSLTKYLKFESWLQANKMNGIGKACDQNLEHIKTLGRKWTISDFIEELMCDDCDNEKYFGIQFLCNECQKTKWFGFAQKKNSD